METRTYAFLFAALAAGSSQGQDIRSATADNLNLPGAWSDGSVPTGADIATWDASSTLVNTLGGNLAWGGLNVSSAGGPVGISGTNTLAAGAISLGGNDLSITTNAANSSFNFSGLAGTGKLTINNGISNLGTTNLNTADALNFNGTLSLRGGNAASGPGAVGGSFFYLGRTGITQAAGTSFSLDTGSSATDAKDVIIDGGAWNGQTIRLSSLTGFGALRRDSGAAGTVTLDVDQAADTVFNGPVLSHTGGNNVDIRQLEFIKEGAGTLTLAGVLGKQTQSAGSNAADINLTISGGTLVLAANNTRTGTTAIGTGATLQIGNGGSTGSIGGTGPVTNEGSLVFDLGSGAASTVANATLGNGSMVKKGDGSLAMSGALDHTGATTVEAGTLLLNGNATSPVAVQSGAMIGAGNHTALGTAVLDTLALESGSGSIFRISGGGVSDVIFVDGDNGLTITGPHVITPVVAGSLATDDTYTAIDYEGTLGGSFSSFQLAPNTRFQLVHNLANTSIDLKYVGGTVTWTGSAGNTWETNGAASWTLGGPTAFFDGDNALFPDGAATGDVTLAGIIAPGSVTFENDSLAYTLTGSGITSGTLTKRGTADTTLAMPASYTGTTLIEEGRLIAGDGDANGETGKGPVQIMEGAVLTIDRSGLLDYKTDARLRNVSGGGDITLEGGATLFNYTGTGTGFAEANSWAGFSGDLMIRDGSEFQTIRNGATAMGTGTIVLGDEASDGSLSQIEGSWTWTNDIVLAGSNSRIINRSGAITGGRALKLQGVISGGGGLSFEDPGASMTGLQLGFILTGENTMSGTLNIPSNVPVRVGGVPGDTDVNQGGGGAAGTLGSATVLNEGILTFSRTDGHAVPNAISGSGQVFIGLATGTEGQSVTFTGTKSYTGPTTVRSGTLLVNTALTDSPVVVDAAGTLAGTGTLGIASAVSGTVSPGDGIGTLTASDDLALEAGSKIAWEISDWNGSAGSGHDLLSAASLTIDASPESPVTVVITAPSLANFSETPKSFTLAATSGGISGLDAGEITVDAGSFPGTGTWSVQTSGNDLILSYALGNAYDTWAGANGIGGEGPDADTDDDGIQNGIEFLIGGDPSGPDSDSNSLLPVATADSTYLNLTFRRSDEAAVFQPYVEYGTGLDDWSEALSGVAGVVIEEVHNGFGNGIDSVTVKIPRTLAAPGGKLFARARIDIP